MHESGARLRRPLAAIVLGAVVASALVVVPATPTALRVVAGLPLVLVLPGLALSAALLPEEEDIARRAMLALALSIVVAILAALAIQVSPWRLGRTTWGYTLGGFTVLTALAAGVRGEQAAGAVAWRRRPRLRDAVLLGAAVALATGAIVWARRPLPPPRGVAGYTQLWLVPQGGGLELGVASFELKPAVFRVELLSDGTLVRQWDGITPAVGGRWTVTVEPKGNLMQALLYKGDVATPYREVTLRVATGPLTPLRER